MVGIAGLGKFDRAGWLAAGARGMVREMAVAVAVVVEGAAVVVVFAAVVAKVAVALVVGKAAAAVVGGRLAVGRSIAVPAPERFAAIAPGKAAAAALELGADNAARGTAAAAAMLVVVAAGRFATCSLINARRR